MREVETEIERKNFIRALFLAKKANLSEDKIKEIAHKAIWQAAGIGRNPYAVKQLAQELGYSKEDVKEILLEQAKREEESGNKKILGFCYDYRSGKYLNFHNWLERLLKEWDKINIDSGRG